jgi:hypothetical protein
MQQLNAGADTLPRVSYTVIPTRLARRFTYIIVSVSKRR